MPGTSSLFDYILQLLANPALAQSFLSDPTARSTEST